MGFFPKPKAICPDAGGNMPEDAYYLLGDRLVSMHEIESLTEASIRLLDRTEGLDHRSMFKSLYDFEGAFDTGFTRLRLLGILLKRRFAYGMALEDHPDYAQFKDALEGIRKEDFSHIWRDPSAKWHATTNPAVAYWSEGQLYCEAGSEIWAKLSELGRFSGADREFPQPIDIVDIADTVVSFAIAKGDKELAAWWYAALPMAIFWQTSSRHPVSAPDDQAFQRIREAVVQSEAYKIETDWGCLCYPERDGDMINESGPDEVRFLQWWFEPLWSASSNTA
jgi:hypothetical protein